MWRILQQENPEDYVLATGKTHSIKDFINFTFDMLKMPLEWEGKNENEIGFEKKTGIPTLIADISIKTT